MRIRICRRDYDVVIQHMKNAAATAAFNHIDTRDPREMDKIKELSLVNKLFRPGVKFFIGAIKNPYLVNLTEYCIQMSIFSGNPQHCIKLAQSARYRDGDRHVTWEYYNLWDYIKGKGIDMWKKQRAFMHVNRIEGFEIVDVHPDKSCIILSFFFYDGHNIFQSKVYKVCLYGSHFYVTDVDSEIYRRVDESVEYYYNQLNY